MKDKYEVTVIVEPKLDYDTGTLELVSRFTIDGISEQISPTIVELEEQCVVEALLSLGWVRPIEESSDA
jgi:hypothetical protein